MPTQVKQGIEVGTYVVDPVHSSIGFAVVHNGLTTFRSGFGEYEAVLTGGEDALLSGSVDVASIEIDEPQLKGHLLSPEFFDVERNPRLEFESSRLELADDGTLALRGELRIGGESRVVEATGRFARIGGDLAGVERIGISLETSVDRRDFGLNWQAELPGGGIALEYEVRISVELELVRESE